MSTICLTDEELAALDKLTEAIKAIAALPPSHPSEYAEMVPHFHALQEKIMARAAVRAHPDLFWAPSETGQFMGFRVSWSEEMLRDVDLDIRDMVVGLHTTEMS